MTQHLRSPAQAHGSFHVGAVSLMPADNIDGFRPEVIAALKQLRFGVLRFPGRQLCLLVRVALRCR